MGSINSMRKIFGVVFILLSINCNQVGKYNTEELSSLLLLGYRQNVTIDGSFFGIYNANVKAAKLGLDGKCDSESRGISTTSNEGSFQISYPRVSPSNGIVCLLAFPKADGTSRFFAVDQQKTINWTGDDKFQVLIMPEPSTTTRSAFSVISTPFNRMAARRLERLSKGNTDPSKTLSNLKTANRQIVSQFGLSRGISRSFSRVSSLESGTPDLNDIPIDFSKADDPTALKFTIMIGGLHKLAIPEKPDTYNDVVKVVAEYISSGTGNSLSEDGKPLLLPKDEPANGGSGLPLSAANSLSTQVSAAVQSFVVDKASELGIPLASVQQITSQVTVQDKPTFGPSAPVTSNEPVFPPPTITFGQTEYYFTLNSKISIFPTYSEVKYFFSKGALPKGLSLDKNTGEISGIVNTLGTSSIQIIASGAGGDKITSIKIEVISDPTISLSNPQDCTRVGSSSTYTCLYNINQGISITPLTGSIVTLSGNGSLPTGLSFNSVDGSITGIIPSSSTSCLSKECSYSITGTSKSGANTSLTIVFIERPTFTYPSQIYSFSSQGLATQPIPNSKRAVSSFSITSSNTSPSGLSINSSTGAISYSGQSDGSYTISIIGTGPGGNSAPVNLVLNPIPKLNINNPPSKCTVSNSQVTCSYFPSVSFSLSPSAYGLTSFSGTGVLPPGLTFNSNLGTISGSPTTERTCGIVSNLCSFIITGQGAGGTTSITISFIEAPSFTYPKSLYTYTANGFVDTPQAVSLRAGTTFSILNNTFSNISINSNGLLSITPANTTQSYSISVIANGPGGSSVEFPIRIVPAPSLAYSTSYTFLTNRSLSITPTSTTGISSFSITPSLPSGLSFNGNNGSITGSTSVAQSNVSYTVTGTGEGGSFSSTFNLTLTTFNKGYLNYTVYNNSSISTYANTPDDFVNIFQTSNLTHSAGHSAGNILLNFTTFSTLVNNGIPIPNSGDRYSVKAYGIFVPLETGTYTFSCDGDDAVDLFINNSNICSFYGAHGFEGDGLRTGSIYLESGKQYSFQARMQEIGGGDGLRIVWRSPSRSNWDINTEELGR